jgi:hypothetical protein
LPDGPAGVLPKGSILKASKKVAGGVAVAALIAGGAFASLTAGASTDAAAGFSGGIITYTSNGETGWYSNNGTQLNEIHDVVDLPSTIESTGNDGGIGDQLGEYQGTRPLVKANPNDAGTVTAGDTCDVTQIGLKYDGTGYQVWEAVGELQFDPTNTDTITNVLDENSFNGGNGNACTQGGSLAADPAASFGAPDVTYSGGYDQVTVGAREILGLGAGPGAQGVDLQPGQAAFLKLEIGDIANGLPFGVVKGTAQALDATVKSNGSYEYSALTPQDFQHIIVPKTFGVYNGGYANVGTVFDPSERSTFASGGGVEEARFDGVRAADGVHKVQGVTVDDDQVLGAYGQYGAESTSNGTSAGAIFAQPSNLGYSVFTVNVGSLVAAG